jgi:hypothetical protein
MHATDTVFIIDVAVDQVGNKGGATGTGGIMQVTTYVTAAVTEPVRMRGASRVQQNPGGAAGGGCQHYRSATQFVDTAIFLVNISYPGRPTGAVGVHLGDHAVGKKIDLPPIEGRVNQRRAGREIRMDRAGTVALPAVKADAALIVYALGQYGLSGRYYRDAKFARAIYVKEFVQARLWSRQEKPIRVVVQAFVTAEHADQLVDLVVVWPDVLVTNRPVVSQAVDIATLEIQRPEPQGNPTPVIGATAQHTGAPPHELGSFGSGKGLVFDLPAAQASVEIAERASGGAAPPARGFPGVAKLRTLLVAGGVVKGPGLDQRHPQAGIGQLIGRHATARP